ncbi:hypothetical protein [Actinokineospora inagensis]|uniref:hypothetical protein n=1 Tax=Actinokineospora inagensis TaxID=103730 RepID=UPI000407023A|nr:hypothetical protein [Actinokineospora inagensis]
MTTPDRHEPTPTTGRRGAVDTVAPFPTLTPAPDTVPGVGRVDLTVDTVAALLYLVPSTRMDWRTLDTPP